MNSFEPAHSPFGGSVATRVLRCPASVSLVEKVPAHLRKVSAYAERGTALHTAMAFLIENTRSLDNLVGATINDYTITADDVENALRPAYAYIDALLDAPGAEFYLEQRVVFPTIDAFGTVDLLIRIGAVLYVIDLKFGAGVRVLALYADGDEDIINAQLAFYAAAARHSLPEFFAGVDEIALIILQPMSIELDAEMVSSVTVTPSSQLTARLARKHSRRRRAWKKVHIAGSARPGRSARRMPVHFSISPSLQCRRRRVRRLIRLPICRCSPTGWNSSTRSKTFARHCMTRRSTRFRTATMCRATRSRPGVPNGAGTTRTRRSAH